jgi:hypothetical protein
VPVEFPVSLPKASGLSAQAEAELQKCATKYSEQVVREAGRFTTSPRHREITAELVRDARDAIGRRGRRHRSGLVVFAQLATYLIALLMTFVGPILWTQSPLAVGTIVLLTGIIATYSLLGDRGV